MKELNMNEAQIVTGGSVPDGAFLVGDSLSDRPGAGPSNPWMPIVVNDLVDKEVPNLAFPYM